MATDQTNVAINLCGRLATAADSVMKGIEQIYAVAAQQSSAGIVFTSEEVEAALAKSNLKHASGDDFNNVITSGTALKVWLEENYHDDVLQKVRSGGTQPSIMTP